MGTELVKKYELELSDCKIEINSMKKTIDELNEMIENMDKNHKNQLDEINKKIELDLIENEKIEKKLLNKLDEKDHKLDDLIKERDLYNMRLKEIQAEHEEIVYETENIIKDLQDSKNECNQYKGKYENLIEDLFMKNQLLEKCEKAKIQLEIKLKTTEENFLNHLEDDYLAARSNEIYLLELKDQLEISNNDLDVYKEKNTN